MRMRTNDVQQKTLIVKNSSVSRGNLPSPIRL
jgi:hypothetical protein